MGTLDGRTVFITGAARGQGRAHAVTVAREGGNVIAVDICGPVEGLQYPLASEADLAETTRLVQEAGGEIVARTADVRDQAALDAAVAEGLERFGRLDGAVANAGLFDVGPMLWETTEAMWATVIDITLSGVWRTIKAAAPPMIAARSGAMVVIASVNGIEPSDGYGSYVVAKTGAIGLMKQAAYELGPHNVRVNGVAPGPIDTRIWNNEMGYGLFPAREDGSPAGRAEAVQATYGYGRLAGRSAIPSQASGNVVAWLLSDLSEYVTGVLVPVDSGHLLNPGWNPAPESEGPVADRYRPPAEAPL
jgi:SDR family mycofactocin-dependent oxidoreductase